MPSFRSLSKAARFAGLARQGSVRCAGAACQHGGVSARRRRSGRLGTSFGPMKRDSPCMWHATCVRVGRCILPISLPEICTNGAVGAAKRSFLEVAAASCNRTHAVATFVVDAAECNERGCRFQYHLRAKIVSNLLEHPHARSGRSAIQRLGHFGPKFDLCDFFRLFGESSRGIRARRSNVRPNARIGRHVEKSAPSVLLRQMLDNAQRRTHARSAAHTPFGSANRCS